MKQALKYILVLISIVSFTDLLLAQPNNWVKKNSFDGTKRERNVGITIGGHAYAGFGHDSGTVVLNDWWEYDPGSDSWTQKASLPGSGRRDAVGFSIGTKGYVGTGDNSNNAQFGVPLPDFWEYNAVTNTWSVKAAYPGGFSGGVYYATGFAINGKGYICGGKQGPSNYLNELWEYNPAVNNWTNKAPFPGGPRYGLSSFVCGNLAYVGLGVDYNVLRRDFWKYNPALNQWTQANNFPGSPRYSASGFGIGQDGFIVFGTDGGYKAELWEYSSTYNFWLQRCDVPAEPRRSGIAFTLGGKGYAGTGLSLLGSKRDMYEYTPLPPLGLNDLELTQVDLKLFPNPMINSSELQIESQRSLGDITLKIFDVSGKLSRSEKIIGNSITIERLDLNSGIYFISIVNEKEILGSTKLFIQ